MARLGINLPNDQHAASSPAELAARAEVERHLSGPLSDAEWAAQRSRLLQFVRMLRRWDLEQQQREVGPKRKAS
jgi:hypothetical protein